jgi:hypothetical protein
MRSVAFNSLQSYQPSTRAGDMRRLILYNLMRYFRIWAALWLCITAIMSLLFGVPKAVLLSWKHATTPGVVTKVDYSNHGVTTVHFAISDRSYSEEFMAIGAGAGTSVMVRYLPGHPTLAMLEEPKHASVEWTIFSSLGGLLFSAFLMGILTFHPNFRAYREKWPVLRTAD